VNRRNSSRRKATKQQKNRKQRESWEEMQERVKRGVHDLFNFWRMCPEVPCRRAQACIGDREPCFARNWPHVPEAEKVGMHAAVRARQNGLSPEESMRAWEEAERAFLAGEHLKLFGKQSVDG